MHYTRLNGELIMQNRKREIEMTSTANPLRINLLLMHSNLRAHYTGTTRANITYWTERNDI